jgi:hypothetical protein
MNENFVGSTMMLDPMDELIIQSIFANNNFLSVSHKICQDVMLRMFFISEDSQTFLFVDRRLDSLHTASRSSHKVGLFEQSIQWFGSIHAHIVSIVDGVWCNRTHSGKAIAEMSFDINTDATRNRNLHLAAGWPSANTIRLVFICCLVNQQKKKWKWIVW